MKRRIFALLAALCLLAGCAGKTEPDAPAAVSYTHLDVYKRQDADGNAVFHRMISFLFPGSRRNNTVFNITQSVLG